MKRMTALICIILLLTVHLAAPVSAAENPVISAECAVLMDQASGQVLLEKNAHKAVYPASVTKIMSLLLFTEAIEQKRMKLTDPVKATAEAVAKGGSQIWLKEGEQMTVQELLRATAIGSANDACTALAVHLEGSEAAFVNCMNARAAKLGMQDTVFENCTGLDDDTKNHLTTAFDVALMSRELLRHASIRQYTTVWMDSLRDGKTQLVNTNKLVRFYKGTTGLKTGTTAKAGCCVSASAERDGLHLIAVVMHADSSNARFDDAKAMLDWGFAAYACVTPNIDPALLRSVPVLHGTETSVTPRMETPQPLLLKKGEEAKLKIKAELPENLCAPVEENQLLGEVTVSIGKRVVAQYPLSAAFPVRALTLGDVLLRLLAALRIRSAKNV